MTSVFTSPHGSIPVPGGRRLSRRLSSTALLAAVLAAGLTVTTTDPARAATAPLLGTTAGFAVLAGTGITNTGPTTITGDIGTHPTGGITGTGLIDQTGAQHINDGVAQLAKTDLVTAYDELEGAPVTTTVVDGELGGGETLTPGVYDSANGELDLDGSLVLDGGGNADAVFIFQAASTLITASASSITLINGAQACNVFWQVGSSATLGGSTAFVGTIAADVSITLVTGATVTGRLLAQSGAVTLDTNTVTTPTCAPGSGGSGSGGSGDGADGGTGGAGGTGQIQRVPVGSVDTGDGSAVVASRLWSHAGGVPSA